MPSPRALPLAALALAAAAACDGRDPRIVASFKQGGGGAGFESLLPGAYYYYASPTVAGGRVYIGTSRKLFDEPAPDNFFFALDERLRKVWELPLGRDEVRGGAAIGADGRIYFVVDKGRVAGERQPLTDYLYCLDADGGFLWEYPLSSGAASWDNDVGMINPAVAADGTIYVGGERLHAIRPDGTLRWTYPAGPETLNVKNAPIVDPAGNVYLAASHQVHSVAPDGTPRWRYPAVAAFDESLSSPAFSRDHARVYAALGTTVSCLDAATGAALWSVTPTWSGTFRATPAVDDADNVYLGTKANRESTFYAIGADGTVLWENRLGADLYSSPALGDDRAVYVGSEGAGGGRERFHALDMATGRRRWSVELPADVTWSSPALVAGGTIYVGSMSGSVYAIRSDATGLLPGAGSPRFRGGNDGTGRHE